MSKKKIVKFSGNIKTVIKDLNTKQQFGMEFILVEKNGSDVFILVLEDDVKSVKPLIFEHISNIADLNSLCNKKNFEIHHIRRNVPNIFAIVSWEETYANNIKT